MRVLVLLLFSFVSVSSFAQWQRYSVSSFPDIFDSSFPANLTGYVCGYGNSFYKTTNGGSVWTDLSFQGTAQNLNAVCFVNKLTGFLASTNDTVYKTSNGGAGWYYRVGIGYPVSNFRFLDSLNGYAFGNNRMSVTSDGGAMWITRNVLTSGSAFFLNNSTGWTTYYPGGGNSELRKTTDGGATWWTMYSTTDFKILYDVFFLNDNTGWVCGYRHFIARTEDGGLSWQQQNEIAGAPGLYSIYFINQYTGWTAGDNYNGNSACCYYTTNGGAVWNKENTVTQGGRLTKIRFSSQDTGWIVGQYGNVFKTGNAGGLTGITSNIGNPDVFSLYQNYPNPFNPSTKIKFVVPEDDFVTLSIFDVLGRETASLFSGRISRGEHEFNFDASGLAGGVYFYKLSSGKFTGVKRMVLSK